ncbi:transposase [Buttiauxella sp. JUb87]|nr:transposase [Buttiauxella sp. JUb87]
MSLARYRQAFSPSGAKDDPQDAELVLELMLRYPQKIKAIEPDNADIRLLQQLVMQRRQLDEDKRRFVNRIINTLKQYYPQPLEWFSHRGSVLLCELIIRWTSLQQLKRAWSDTIRNFLNVKGGRAMALTEQRVASIDNALPLTTDPSVIEANALMATALATQIKVVSEIIKPMTNESKRCLTHWQIRGCSNHFWEWGCVWAHGCLLHLVITVTGLTALNKFKTMQVLHR